MNDLALNDKIIDKVKNEMVEQLLAVLQSDIVKVILYGSCARGDYNSDSDIDVALIIKCDRMDAKKYGDDLARIATGFAMKYFVIVNFVCLPCEEFLEKKEWYQYFHNIDAEGEVLYG